MYNGPITRQTFNYANRISCNNIPQRVIALDPDNYEHYVQGLKPVLRETKTLFE